MSSVLVFNARGTLSESLFDTLALACRFAEHIEGSGDRSSRPALCMVIRDFVLELVDKNFRTITSDQYLEQALHALPRVGQESERSQGAREARESLLRFFSQRGCITLVQPSIEESQLQQLGSVPLGALRPEFRAGVDALRTRLIAAWMANPKTFGSRTSSCTSFVNDLERLVAACNDSAVVSMTERWEAIQHSACDHLAAVFQKTARAMFRRLVSGQGAQLPMTDEALSMVFCRQRQELKSQWDVHAVGDAIVQREYWQEIEEVLVQEEAAIRLLNARIGNAEAMQAGANVCPEIDVNDDPPHSVPLQPGFVHPFGCCTSVCGRSLEGTEIQVF